LKECRGHKEKGPLGLSAKKNDGPNPGPWGGSAQTLGMGYFGTCLAKKKGGKNPGKPSTKGLGFFRHLGTRILDVNAGGVGEVMPLLPLTKPVHPPRTQVKKRNGPQVVVGVLWGKNIHPRPRLTGHRGEKTKKRKWDSGGPVGRKQPTYNGKVPPVCFWGIDMGTIKGGSWTGEINRNKKLDRDHTS